MSVHLKLWSEAHFPVCPYAIKEDQRLGIEKELNMPRKLGIIRRNLMRYNYPVLPVKIKDKNLDRICKDFGVLNDKLVKKI